MNKILSNEALFDLLTYGVEKNIHPSSYYNDLFNNEDFIRMILNQPFDISNILKIIDNKRKRTFSLSTNCLRYIAFLTVEFIDKTIIDIRNITSYIQIDDVINNFNYYHSQDIDETILNLITNHNERFKIRKLNINKIDEDNILNLFLRLYPLKKYQYLKNIYDTKLSLTLYYSDINEIIIYSDDPSSLFSNQYFTQRYVIGNKVICFTKDDYHISPNNMSSSIELFIMNTNEIRYYESSGKLHIFKISN